MAAVVVMGSQWGDEGKGKIVDDDEQMALVDIFFGEPIAHGIPAEVHKGCGF